MVNVFMSIDVNMSSQCLSALSMASQSLTSPLWSTQKHPFGLFLPLCLYMCACAPSLRCHIKKRKKENVEAKFCGNRVSLAVPHSFRYGRSRRVGHLQYSMPGLRWTLFRLPLWCSHLRGLQGGWIALVLAICAALLAFFNKRCLISRVQW